MTCNGNKKRLCLLESCKECFEKSFASHEKAVFWSAENKKTPREVFRKSDKKYRFTCGVCNHAFEKSLDKIKIGRWCPYCSHTSLCENLGCQECFENSFASHPKAAFWSAENKEMSREVFRKSTNKKYKFQCNECSHSFESVLYHITNGSWCPYCSHTSLCVNLGCQECFENSFASHPKAAFWSAENKEIPREVFKSTPDKYKLKCETCCHVFESALSHITAGTWCPYCSKPPKSLCENPDCQECYKKTFASHPKAAYWSAENNKTPREVFKNDNDKYKFQCNECSHMFESALNNINAGKWCPHCVNKTEKILYEWLTIHYPSVQREKTFEWCKNPTTDRCYRYDFCIEPLKCLIELDGAQHFTQVSNWNAPRLTQETDIFKMKKANTEGYTILRLLQEDVFYDRIDWKHELTQALQGMDSGHHTSTNLYICKNNEYDEHKALFIELHDRDILPVDEDEDAAEADEDEDAAEADESEDQ